MKGRDDFKKAATKPRPDIATRAELEWLRADRLNDLPSPAHTHPRPDWAVVSDLPQRMRIRKREHRIRVLEERLGMARESFERGWEHS